jgi:hypothetical protein
MARETYDFSPRASFPVQPGEAPGPMCPSSPRRPSCPAEVSQSGA